MKKFLIILPLILTACNFIHVKPNSMEPNSHIFAEEGGWHMRMLIKPELEKRGHTITVGTAAQRVDMEGNDLVGARIVSADGTKYRTTVRESSTGTSAFLMTPICIITLNGFHFWQFNISIADQKTGEELLAWSGMGCSNWQMRRFRRLMNQLER